MTRCRCRGARGRPPSAPGPRGAIRSGAPVLGCVTPSGGRSAPRCCPRTGPSAAWGGISRRPAAAPTPASRPPARPAAPIGGGRSVPEWATQAPASRSQRPSNGPEPPGGAVSTARQPRSAPPEGRSALHGVLPVRLHGRAAPISALQRCPLRAASSCMSALAQPGSRSAAAISADQRLDVPSPACLCRPAGRGIHLCRPADPPRDPRPAPRPPPLSSRPPLGAGAPSAAPACG